MANYKLNEEAEDDMRRLYRWGILNFGLTQADLYYDGLIERFENLADNPFLSSSVAHIRKEYRRSVFYSHSIYYLLIRMIKWKLCECWGNKILIVFYIILDLR